MARLNKRYYLFFLLPILLWSCAEKISDEKLINILKDLHVASSIYDMRRDLDIELLSKPDIMYAVLRKYEITETELEEAIRERMANVSDYQALLVKVNERLVAQLKTVEEQVKIEDEKKRIADSIATAQEQQRLDSIAVQDSIERRLDSLEYFRLVEENENRKRNRSKPTK